MLITSGTGHVVLRHMLASDLAEIRIFRCDEKRAPHAARRRQAAHGRLSALATFSSRTACATIWRASTSCSKPAVLKNTVL
jgi:hypothetical protein